MLGAVVQLAGLELLPPGDSNIIVDDEKDETLSKNEKKAKAAVAAPGLVRRLRPARYWGRHQVGRPGVTVPVTGLNNLCSQSQFTYCSIILANVPAHFNGRGLWACNHRLCGCQINEPGPVL